MSTNNERPSSFPPATPHADAVGEGDDERAPGSGPKKLVERLIKKGFESGIGAISKSQDTVHGVIEGLKVPKEIAMLALDQIDETKNGLYRAVAKEMRDFLQSTNFAHEAKKILTGLAFEVKMEVRFKDATDNEGKPTVRPDVTADVAVRDRTPAPAAAASKPSSRESRARKRRPIE